jgi:hypothetical protein
MNKMRSPVLVLSALFVVFAASAGIAGQTATADKSATPGHIVSPGEIRAAAAAAPDARGMNIKKIAGFLDTDAARAQLGRWGIGADRAKAAVASLDDDELAYLAARADGVMARLEGGSQSLWLVAGIAAAVVLVLCIYLLATTEY